MNRRNVLVGLAAIVVMSGVLLGTGAFSQVSADRSVTVDVADDSNALIGLEPGSGANDIVKESGHTVEINATSSNLGNDANGLNDKATTRIDNGLNIINNHDNEINVTFSTDGMNGNSIFFQDEEDNISSVTISPEGNVELDVVIKTSGSGSFSDGTVTFKAEPTN